MRIDRNSRRRGGLADRLRYAGLWAACAALCLAALASSLGLALSAAGGR